MYKAKILRFLMFLLLVGSQLTALEAQNQRKATSAEQQRILAEISAVATKIRTFSCNFTQTNQTSFMEEDNISEGKLEYVNGGKFILQYTAPTAYRLTFDRNEMTTSFGGKTTKMDMRNNRTVQNISESIINCISGKSLSNNNDFNIAIYIKGNTWVAKLNPKRANLKKMMKNMTIQFNSSRKVVERLVINQANDDVITFAMRNIKMTYRK